MATREELLIEADRRGLLQGEQKTAFDEAVRRGIITVERPPGQTDGEDSGVLPAPAVELASAAVRGVTEAADFFTTGPVNTISSLVGSDFRVPTFTGAAQSVGAAREDYMEPGTAREAVQAGGELLPAAAGIAGAVKGIPSLFSRQSPVREKITDLAQRGDQSARELVERIGVRTSGDVSTATKAVSESGRIVKDTLAKNAIKQGFDEGVIAAVKASSPETRGRLRGMVDILEKGRKNRRYGVVHRPTDVVGDAITDRVVTIRNANKKAGQALEREAQNLVGKPVDVSPAVGGFLDDLERLGVSVGEDLKPSFEGSDIEGITGAERVIRNVLARARRLDGADAYEAHRLKRFIDEQVTFGKNTEGLAGRAEAALKALRRSVDQQLDESFQGYRKANDSYAETIQALNAFQDVAGRKIDLVGPNAEKAIGTLSRRLMSNVQSRVNMLNALEELDNVAAKYGKKPKDDVLTLALFADELDSVFKPAARTSLGGELAKTAAIEGQMGLVRTGIEKGIDFVKNVNEEQALKEIKALLSR